MELASATEIRAGVAARRMSAEQVVREALERTKRLNPRVNAVVTLAPTALEQARAIDAALDRGEEPGMLCGVPVGIKDTTPVAGLRHTCGSPLLADNVARTDALVVQRLRDAGAVILGKTNTPEFAVGGHTVNEVFGPTRNPWNPELSAGGSTGGGAAALACGMIALAEGTDLGGSLRIPAAFCGVVGMRPSPGLVPAWPSEFAWDMLQVGGFMARRAEDVALALQAVAGPSPLAPIAQGLDLRDLVEMAAAGARGARVAYCPDVAGIGIDEGIEKVCRQAAESLAGAGAEVQQVDLDLSWARDAFLALRGLWMLVQHLDRLEIRDRLGERLRANLERGLALEPLDLARAERARGLVWERFRQLFARFDLLLTPATAVPPFPVEQSHPESVSGRRMENYIDWVAPTFVVSLAGLPAASVPAGLSDGLPVGLQIVGPQNGDGQVLGAAAVLQRLAPVGAPPLE